MRLWRGCLSAPAEAETMGQHEDLVDGAPASPPQTPARRTGPHQRVVDRMVVGVADLLANIDGSIEAPTDGMRCPGFSEVPPAVRRLVAQQHAYPLATSEWQRRVLVAGVLTPEHLRVLQPGR
jgi:hypothetical protein